LLSLVSRCRLRAALGQAVLCLCVAAFCILPSGVLGLPRRWMPRWRSFAAPAVVIFAHIPPR
jgi:hypothetical protein